MAHDRECFGNTQQATRQDIKRVGAFWSFTAQVQP